MSEPHDDSPVYVLAGNHRQALVWFLENRVPPRRQRYIGAVDQIMGIRGVTIHRVGTWFANPSYQDCEDFDLYVRLAESAR